ncbi:MAG TPA: hypothetical protein DCL54_03970 [Alphaproteobacteria bacterium]|nr:hypothetical protein [Alphaproteobacteria bacterium]
MRAASGPKASFPKATPLPRTDLVTLTLGRQSLQVLVDCGAIARWQWEGADILRPASLGAITTGEPLDLACFVMAPWVNRIAHGRFRAGGQDYSLSRDAACFAGPHALHGLAWRGTWEAVEPPIPIPEPCSLLHLRHRGGEPWPWAYSVALSFGLIDTGLRIVLTLTHEGWPETPMPASLGLHPFFPRRRGVLLQAPSAAVMLTEDDLPRSAIPIPEPWDFTTLRAVPLGGIDHCFTGWDGNAEIVWPHDGVALRLTVGPAPFYQLYAPDTDYFCFEPQTAAPNAVNGSEPVMLRPLRSLSIEVTLEPMLF